MTSAAPADNQVGVKDNPIRSYLFSTDQTLKHAHRLNAQLMSGRRDCGQRWINEIGNLDIVIANNGDILRHQHPVLLNRSHCANSKNVGNRE